MKRTILLLLGCMVALGAAFAVPRELPKAKVEIEFSPPSFHLDVQIVNVQAQDLVEISPGDVTDTHFNFNVDAEATVFNWSPRMDYEYRTSREAMETKLMRIPGSRKLRRIGMPTVRSC